MNTAALNGITLPLADDGSDLNCPSLENVVIPTLTRALGSPRLRHQERRYVWGVMFAGLAVLVSVSVSVVGRFDFVALRTQA